MPPSLEIAFWVALLTFPLIQIVLSMLVQADLDILIRYLTGWGVCINLVSFVPFLFTVIYSIVFLVTSRSGWDTATAVVVGIVCIVAIVALLKLQAYSARVALVKSIDKAIASSRRKPVI
jgi:hypothetical protein